MFVTREIAGDRNPFLRFQVGEEEQRAEQSVLYENSISKKIVGYSTTGRKTTVFRLIGWGRTLAEAETMAGRRVISARSRVEERVDMPKVTIVATDEDPESDSYTGSNLACPPVVIVAKP